MRQLSGCCDDLEVSIVTWSSKCMDNARPITSNPGPMLAEEQGVLITKEVAAIVEEGGQRRDQEKKEREVN